MKGVIQSLQLLQHKPALKWYWLLALLAVIFIPHVVISYNLLQQSLMPDLHVRIIGSRWMDLGQSPYFSHWQPGYSAGLYNPYLPAASGLNGVTVTPALLWLQLPLSKLPYCTIKIIWWLAMETMLFATIFLTCKCSINLLRQLTTIVILSFFFIYSPNWWLHVTDGQLHIAYTLLFALSAYMIIRRKKRFFTLISYTLSVVLRPLFIVALIPWFVNFNRKRRLAFFASFMIAIGLMAVAAPLKGWLDYKKAMNQYSKENTSINQKSIMEKSLSNVSLESCVMPSVTVEQFKAGNVLSMQHNFKQMGFNVTNLFVYVLLLLIIIAGIILHTKPNLNYPANENLILLSFVFYILAEILTPGFRNPTNLIQYAGIAGVFINKANVKIILLFITGLMLNRFLPVELINMPETGELFMLVALYLGIILKPRPDVIAVK